MILFVFHFKTNLNWFEISFVILFQILFEIIVWNRICNFIFFSFEISCTVLSSVWQLFTLGLSMFWVYKSRNQFALFESDSSHYHTSSSVCRCSFRFVPQDYLTVMIIIPLCSWTHRVEHSRRASRTKSVKICNTFFVRLQHIPTNGWRWRRDSVLLKTNTTHTTIDCLHKRRLNRGV